MFSQPEKALQSVKVGSQKNKYLAMTSNSNANNNARFVQKPQTETQARSVSPNILNTFYPPDKKFAIQINNLKDESKLYLNKLLFYTGKFTDKES